MKQGCYNTFYNAKAEDVFTTKAHLELGTIVIEGCPRQGMPAACGTGHFEQRKSSLIFYYGNRPNIVP